MTCDEARLEIGESVHGGNRLADPLAAHLKTCGECEAEWESQQDLGRHLDAMRELAAAHRPPLDRRAQLMRDFASRHQKRRPVLSERWGVLAAAAALILVAGASPRLWDLLSPRNRPAVAADTAESDGQEGFIAVPYAPALASGEALRVVRTELYPAALVSLGVDVDPTLTGKMPADLLVGEDGYPRAVRVSSETESNF